MDEVHERSQRRRGPARREVVLARALGCQETLRSASGLLVTWALSENDPEFLVSTPFADRLTTLCSERGPVCAGIDPRPPQLPPNTDAVTWGEEVCALLGGRVAAIKPQLAFFADDWRAVERLGPAAQAGGCVVIADCKRGDIGSTARAYAERILGADSPCDAVTLNPYLGGDSLEPWIEVAVEHGKGLFVLVKTSNAGSADLQDLKVDGELICERVARLVDRLGSDHVGDSGRSLVGAVVGLTAPRDLIARLRALMPRAYFLMPGYGAQGGDPACLEAARDAQGGGVLVSASRSLTHPWKGPAPKGWSERVLSALEAMRTDVCFGGQPPNSPQTLFS